MFKTLVFVAMCLLGLVSIWTTYASLHDSILPEPSILIPIGPYTWDCSIVALGLSVAIGIMLFALKMAIVDEEKRLSLLGCVGLFCIAFISITFNMDVLYRTADREFYLRYSTGQVKDVYGKYLTEVRSNLTERRTEVAKSVAGQEGELESEVKGLREAPAGYGARARQEEYRLTVLSKTSEVELQSYDEAIQSLQNAEQILGSDQPKSIIEVEQLQDKLRVAMVTAGSVAGLPMPEAVRLDNPFFAVFARLMDFETVGIKEIFFLIIAFFLDLGDILGYSLVPNKTKRPKPRLLDGPGAWRPAELVPIENETRLPVNPDRAPTETIEMAAENADTAADAMALRPHFRRPGKKAFPFGR